MEGQVPKPIRERKKSLHKQAYTQFLKAGGELDTAEQLKTITAE